MSSDIQSNNKRIARNTMMLYIRMGITMLVGLFIPAVLYYKCWECQTTVYMALWVVL